MKLENQVCSLEISKKLKELGVKQEMKPHDFYWVKAFQGDYKLMGLDDQEDSPSETNFEWFKAFSVAELGEISANYTTFMKTLTGKWLVRWTDTNHYDFGAEKYHQVVADTEADARGKCLIYLIENGLIKL